MGGDLSYVAQTKHYDGTKAALRWVVIFDQHIKENGLPDSYVQYIEKMKKAVHYYDLACHGQKWQVVKARVYEAEAQQLLSGEGEKIETVCAKISKYMGFPVRAHECSVSEFYNYVAIMGSGH